MKNTFYILIALLLLMVACGRPSANAPLSAELQRAEDLMYPHPDSALHILQTMTPPVDELNRATWALFTTQAKYKLFMTQSDSLLNIAFPYFMAKGDAQRRAMVLYYRAALYREENKMEEAQEYYLKAKDEVDLLDDYFLKYLIYAELGHIYARTLPDYGMEYYTKALNFAQNSGIPKQLSHSCIISSYIDIARMHSQKKEYQQALSFYKKAVDTAQNNKDYSKQMAALKEMATIYRKNNDFQSALVCMQKTYQIANSHSIKWSCAKFLTLGRIYIELNQLDSAANNLNKALLSSDIYTKAGAYSSLFHIYKNKGKHKEAISHLEQAWILQDSISSIEKSQALIEMQEKYDEQRVRDELTNQMRLQEQRTWTWVSISVVVMISVFLFVWIQIKRKNQERINRLAEAEERIETLNHLLEEAQKEPSPDAGQDDTFFKRILLQQLGIIRMVANTPTAQNQALLRRLAETGNDEMPAEELIAWKDLYPIIDRLYHGFYTRLTQHFGSVLTDKEVQTCCLLCAGFSTKEIAVITRQASGTVYVRKSSSRQKMGAPDGADIVEWVKELE